MDFEGPFWTDHERAALRLIESRQGARGGPWIPVRTPQPGVWYDWANPATGQVGQCRCNRDGWSAAPWGERPVVLAWVQGDRPTLPLDDELEDVGPCLCGRKMAGMDGAEGPTDERRVRVEE